MSVSPSSVLIQPGESATVALLASATGGFSEQVTVEVSGLPATVTMSPSSVILTPGAATALSLVVNASASASNATVTFSGSSGSLTHSAQLTLGVVLNVVSTPPPFRMRYVRTDAATTYSDWFNLNWIVYNPPTSRFFVTDPATNRVFAIDASTQSEVGVVMVPGAFSIDDTPDHKTLYVGTQIGDLYAIDPVGMTVAKRYPAAAIGPSGFRAYIALVMADGRLALVGGQGGLPGIDGYGEFAIWNPADNSLDDYPPAYCGEIGAFGAFTRTPDRTQVVLASVANSGSLCEIDESGVSRFVDTAAGNIQRISFSPDGNWIVVPGYMGQAVVLNAETLIQVSQFNVAGDTSSAAGFIVGADSKTLYTPSNSIVYAYDLTTGQQVGWLPNVVVQFLQGGLALGPYENPNLQAMDTTGLMAGPLEEGVGFIDTTSTRTGAVGSQFLNAYLEPAAGPASGGTSTGWSTSTNLSAVYFGGQKATFEPASPTAIMANTPAGSPGPADVSALAADGGVQLLPEAFSYGPTVLEVTPNAATTGGGTGQLTGYGLGPVNSRTVPSDLHISVGGKSATVTKFTGSAYNSSSPPFPLEGAVYTIPEGSVGSADVTVSTSSGSTTVHGGMTYLPAIQQFPLPGASLAQGVFDSQQDVYYFTDATKIQVFSKSSGAWMNPITLPTSYAPERLWGLALSPDGSKLAVADAGGRAIYVLNPASPSAMKKFAVPQPITAVDMEPIGVAISDVGTVYFTVSTTGGTGYDTFFKLNTGTGAVMDYRVGTNTPETDNYLRTVIKADNSTVYGNDDGAVFSVDTASDAVTYAKIDPACCYGDYDLSLSADQSVFAATGYFYDPELHAASYLGLNLREMMNISYFYGEKLSPDGAMMFQPTSLGIDVLDARLGNLLKRIALPVTLSANYDALVSDGTDNVLVAITGANGDGVAVIDLTSIPMPSALPYLDAVRPRARTAGTYGASFANTRKAPQEQASRGKPLRRTVSHQSSRALLTRPRLVRGAR